MVSRRIAFVLSRIILPAILVALFGVRYAGAQAVTFAQVNYATPSSGATVAVPFRARRRPAI